MIETYPNFSKLDINNRQEITGFTSKFEPYSDFDFTSLFCWNTDGSIEVAWLNGNLVIRMPDYLDGHTVYSILGDQAIDQSISSLLNTTHKLELLPEIVIQAIQNKSVFSISEDADNSDYVYDLEHLSKMAGAHFKKKRNKVNTFVKDHENYELVIKVVRDIDAEHIQVLKDLDHQWTKVNPRDAGDILSERKALDNLLNNFASIKPILTEVWVDGDLKAFSVNEVLANGYSICHFEKALKTHHDNIYTFLAAEVAKHLQAEGCKLVNWEQDLGLEGLRRSKQSYHPVKMLKKYTLSAYSHVSAEHHNQQ